MMDRLKTMKEIRFHIYDVIAEEIDLCGGTYSELYYDLCEAKDWLDRAINRIERNGE